jgi:transglutaminase-like putative cysteine protease
MSQANWIEYFRKESAQPAPESKERELNLPAWLVDWETWLTLGLTLLVFLSVARSIESAHWVDGMPSLTLVSLFAILAGLVLSRIHWPEPLLDLIALLLGVLVVIGMTLTYMHPTSLQSGLVDFWHRFGQWLVLVQTGGISNDVMPFIALVLALTWIAAFLSAWSIFRWHNAWLALIPGGIGLLTNISYLPGQFSLDFVVFLFGAILLVMRSHMRNRERDWVRKGLQYPSFLSLTLLNATVWVAVGLLIFAWVIPLASEAPAISNAWNAISSPFSSVTDWSRLFSSIDSKREVPLHNFGPTLPLQGKVVLSDREVAEVDFGDQSNYGRNLRAAVYDEYTPTGWKQGTRQQADLGQNGVAGGEPAAKSESAYKDRKDVSVAVVIETPEQALLSIGDPVSSNADSRAEIINGGTALDVGAIRPKRDLKPGDTYTETGSVSQASVESLQAASTTYPEWVKARYTQLPASLPQRVRDYAQQVTQGSSNAYDKATAIEAALRAFPDTYDIPSVPPGRDAVDYFLSDLKRGYSDYQASAMVVLLRSLGVPARLATGFSVGEFDLNSHRYIIRENNAISWPEVFFPGYGWEEFSPFGGAPQVNRPSASADSAADNTAASDQGNDTGDVPDDTGDTSAALGNVHSSSILPVVLFTGFGLLVFLGLSGIGALGARIAWERGLSEFDYPTQLWEKSLRLTTWLKMGPHPNQTPSEYSRQLTRALPDASGIEPISQSYLRARYGQKQVDSAERTRLDGAWKPLRNALIRRLLRWRKR